MKMGKHTCITLCFECGKLLRQSHHVIYFCAIHNGEINTDEELICSTFTLVNVCELHTVLSPATPARG